MQSKLMKIYDTSYDDTMSKVLSMHRDREVAKRIMGEMYKETREILGSGTYNILGAEAVYKKVKAQHGIE